jgi:hypothetical protein
VAGEAVDSGAANRSGRRELQGDCQRDRFVEQVVIFKQIGEAWHRLMEQPPHLHHQSGTLLDQVMPVT